MRDRLTFGFEMLFGSSDVFSEIGKNSTKASVDECWKDISRFKRVSFVRTILTSYEHDKEILQSLSKIDDFSKIMHDVKLSEGYSVNQVWDEIISYIRRVNRTL
jgi:hypothetical protein